MFSCTVLLTICQSQTVLLCFAEDMLGLSFQLASLEENAVINIWVGHRNITSVQCQWIAFVFYNVKVIHSNTMQC